MIIGGLVYSLVIITTVRNFLLLRPLDKYKDKDDPEFDPEFEDPKSFTLLPLCTTGAGAGFLLQANALCMMEY